MPGKKWSAKQCRHDSQGQMYVRKMKYARKVICIDIDLKADDRLPLRTVFTCLKASHSTDLAIPTIGRVSSFGSTKAFWTMSSPTGTVRFRGTIGSFSTATISSSGLLSRTPSPTSRGEERTCNRLSTVRDRHRIISH